MTSVVQTGYIATTATTSISVTLGATPTPGNLLVAVWTVRGGPTTPSYPWSGSPDVTVSATPTTILLAAYASSKVAGASEPATITASSVAARNMTLSVFEVAPTSGKSWLGFDTSATSSSATTTSLAIGPTGTQAQSDNFAAAAVTLLGGSGGFAQSWTNGFTTTPTPSGTDRGFSGYAILAATTAVSSTASWTTSNEVAGLIATYKQQTASNVAITGAVSDLATAAPAGTVTLVSNVALAGVAATLDLAAPAGTVSAASTAANVSLTGALSDLAIAAPPGTLSAGSVATNISLTGIVSDLTLAAPAGTVTPSSAVTDVTLTGVTATLTIDSPAGTVDTSGSVALTGEVAVLTLSAPAGTLALGSQVNITGEVASITIGAPPGTFSTRSLDDWTVIAIKDYSRRVTFTDIARPLTIKDIP